MTDERMPLALAEAIGRADPAWVDQPSHIRRRLEEVLGSDARQRRAEIHLLVVAAEERVPRRLRRDGWSSTQQTELTDELASSRGWTRDAAEWAVVTWAAALGLMTQPQTETTSGTTGRSSAPGPAGVPDRSEKGRRVTADRTALPSVIESPVDATVQPSLATSSASVDPTVLPTDMGGDGRSVDSSNPSPAHRSLPVEPPTGASRELPRRGTKRSTARAAQLLGHPVDVAYEARTGASPLLLLLATPIGLASFALPAASGVLLLAFVLVMAIGSKVWPTRLIAFRGSEVWVLRNVGGKRVQPDAVVAHTGRDRIRRRPALLLHAVDVDGIPLWFQYPFGPAAKAMPLAAGPGERP